MAPGSVLVIDERSKLPRDTFGGLLGAVLCLTIDQAFERARDVVRCVRTILRDPAPTWRAGIADRLLERGLPRGCRPPVRLAGPFGYAEVA